LPEGQQVEHEKTLPDELQPDGLVEEERRLRVEPEHLQNIPSLDIRIFQYKIFSQ
jgi:hypothetical protein